MPNNKANLYSTKIRINEVICEKIKAIILHIVQLSQSLSPQEKFLHDSSAVMYFTSSLVALLLLDGDILLEIWNLKDNESAMKECTNNVGKVSLQARANL